ncbi:MAG: alpha/beta hydrolase-fold protein [Saprospiraceae bacterium]|nr:alpha/beta hydrolase-fold protein [Saprospiraceae bacterium]
MKKYTLLLLTIGSLLIFHEEIIGQSAPIEFEIVDSLFSTSLDENRDFWVKLPENYQPNGDQKYPVVYLLDGFSLQNTLETVYNNYWGHYLPHMILVGISNRNNRTKDLTPSQVKMRRGSAMNTETGGADKFTQFIEKELIPYIDNTYPTTPYRTLIGHSYAGLFAINVLINHSHLFENYIAIDPSLDWDSQKLVKQAKENLKTESLKGKSLYVSLAAEQLHMFDEKITLENIMTDTSEFTLFARSIIDFSNFVESRTESGLNFSWKIYPEDLHGTVPLPSMRDGLIFLFKWYQFMTPEKYNNPATSVDELAELLKRQEEIYLTHFGYHVPPMIEELLSGYGYMNMQMGQPERAHLFFKMNIHYYPKSANAYDSMAEYYEAQNDIPNALKFAQKAAELSDKDYYKNRIEALKNK